MFYIRKHSIRIQVSIEYNQWYTALDRLERTIILLSSTVELRKLIPSAINIYNKHKTLYQHDAIIKVQKFLMYKINLLENNNE
jgi:hypothetical protein